MILTSLRNILDLDICELWLEIDGLFFCTAVQGASSIFPLGITNIESNDAAVTTTILGNNFLHKVGY